MLIATCERTAPRENERRFCRSAYLSHLCDHVFVVSDVPRTPIVNAVRLKRFIRPRNLESTLSLDRNSSSVLFEFPGGKPSRIPNLHQSCEHVEKHDLSRRVYAPEELIVGFISSLTSREKLDAKRREKVALGCGFEALSSRLF